MNILVFNAGSGSIRMSLFNIREIREGCYDEPLWEGKIDASEPGQPEGKIVIKISDRNGTREGEVLSEDASTDERVRALIRVLERDKDLPKENKAISVVGHRVVHGGDRFTTAVEITHEVEAEIHALCRFAPLHNPQNLMAFRTARRVLDPSVKHFAVFDTAFHHSMSKVATTYAGPKEWREIGIRKYGFHGTSYRWASARAAKLLQRERDEDLSLLICHLGGGSSLCATIGGRSIDTTMGFTPLDGLAMCTRSGAIDPGILIHLMREGMTVGELETLLNKKSGMLGLSGFSCDTRILIPEADRGDKDARFALDVFIYRLRAGIGQMMASLGRLPDAIVFTDVIGVDSPTIRGPALEPFRFLGIEIDDERNAVDYGDCEISADESKVKVLVIKSRETWQIACECYQEIDSKQSMIR